MGLANKLPNEKRKPCKSPCSCRSRKSVGATYTRFSRTHPTRNTTTSCPGVRVLLLDAFHGGRPAYSPDPRSRRALHSRCALPGGACGVPKLGARPRHHRFAGFSPTPLVAGDARIPGVSYEGNGTSRADPPTAAVSRTRDTRKKGASVDPPKGHHRRDREPKPSFGTPQGR
jgi:hypothetical protein